MWGVTAQNEPDIGLREDFPFQCMGYEPEEIADFVKNYLVFVTIVMNFPCFF